MAQHSCTAAAATQSAGGRLAAHGEDSGTDALYRHHRRQQDCLDALHEAAAATHAAECCCGLSLGEGTCPAQFGSGKPAVVETPVGHAAGKAGGAASARQQWLLAEPPWSYLYWRAGQRAGHHCKLPTCRMQRGQGLGQPPDVTGRRLRKLAATATRRGIEGGEEEQQPSCLPGGDEGALSCEC